MCINLNFKCLRITVSERNNNMSICQYIPNMSLTILYTSFALLIILATNLLLQTESRWWTLHTLRY
jgi:hypothetical protein